MTTTLNADLELRDLTDPSSGPHAIQQLIDEILAAVTAHRPGGLCLERGYRIVEVKDNYDRLGYGADARTRDIRYTRYVDETRMLRSQTSALIPPVLRRLAAEPLDQNGRPGWPWARSAVTIACPGLVYRRDLIDRLHTGTPHQMDLWHLTAAPGADSRDELHSLIAAVLAAALPGVPWRANEAGHPYTDDGLEIEAWLADPGTPGPGIGGSGTGGQWVEVGECGRARRGVLEAAGMPAYVSGLALGLGLDRLVMLRKGCRTSGC